MGICAANTAIDKLSDYPEFSERDFLEPVSVHKSLIKFPLQRGSAISLLTAISLQGQGKR